MTSCPAPTTAAPTTSSSRAPPVAALASTAAAVALVLVTAARAGLAAAATDPDPRARTPHVVLVAPAEALAPLMERVMDLLGDMSPAVEVERGAAFHPEELFWTDRVDALRPTVWVVVDGSYVRVRAAGAGRQRFVFRDIAVSVPLTEIDRERVGQTSKAALTAVIDGDAAALERDDAVDASAAAASPAPPAARAPTPVVEREMPIALGLGALYELQTVGYGYGWRHGPGIVVAAEYRPLPLRPGLWLLAQYDLPSTVDSGGARFSVSDLSLRAGASVAPLPWLRVDIGGGADLVRTRALASSPPVSFVSPENLMLGVLHFGVRLGPKRLGGVALSIAAHVERTRPAKTFFVFVGDSAGYRDAFDLDATHLGGSLTLWWR
jgi:hypothetical protein